MNIIYRTQICKPNGAPCESIPLPVEDRVFVLYRSSNETWNDIPVFSQFLEPIEDEI
jgi:hypothetical protein